jgi:hypothetical protein
MLEVGLRFRFDLAGASSRSGAPRARVGKRAWIADRNRPQFMASFVPVNNRVVWR